jgi:tetratricopeptide (TPR) repeat protein
VHINTGRYDKAVPFLERLVKANAKNGAGYYYLAVSYAALKNDAKAIATLEQALKLKYGEGAEVWSQKEFAAIRNSAPFKALMTKYFPGEKF